MGGVHHLLFQDCGIYSAPLEPEKVVHSMEHGAVWVTYEPGLPAGEIAFLQDIVRDQEYLTLRRFPGQRNPTVLTTWGVQLELRSITTREHRSSSPVIGLRWCFLSLG